MVSAKDAKVAKGLDVESGKAKQERVMVSAKDAKAAKGA